MAGPGRAIGVRVVGAQGLQVSVADQDCGCGVLFWGARQMHEP